jgi:hypothetical protein
MPLAATFTSALARRIAGRTFPFHARAAIRTKAYITD